MPASTSGGPSPRPRSPRRRKSFCATFARAGPSAAATRAAPRSGRTRPWPSPPARLAPGQVAQNTLTARPIGRPRDRARDRRAGRVRRRPLAAVRRTADLGAAEAHAVLRAWLTSVGVVAEPRRADRADAGGRLQPRGPRPPRAACPRAARCGRPSRVWRSPCGPAMVTPRRPASSSRPACRSSPTSRRRRSSARRSASSPVEMARPVGSPWWSTAPARCTASPTRSSACASTASPAGRSRSSAPTPGSTGGCRRSPRSRSRSTPASPSASRASRSLWRRWSTGATT